MDKRIVKELVKELKVQLPELACGTTCPGVYGLALKAAIDVLGGGEEAPCYRFANEVLETYQGKCSANKFITGFVDVHNWNNLAWDDKVERRTRALQEFIDYLEELND